MFSISAIKLGCLIEYAIFPSPILVHARGGIEWHLELSNIVHRFIFAWRGVHSLVKLTIGVIFVLARPNKPIKALKMGEKSIPQRGRERKNTSIN